MSAEENKMLFRRIFNEYWNAGKLELADELIAQDFIEHQTVPGIESQGREGNRQAVRTLRAAFPDLRFTVEDMIAEGDVAAARVIMSGTHQGELFGMAPTGRQFTVTGMHFLRFSDGKAVEHWGITDDLGMMQQLGVASEPGEGAS